MKTLATFIDWIQRLGKKPDPDDLKMGLIRRYAIIVPQEEVATWVEKGWKEEPAFRVSFHPLPQGIMAVFGKPKTILEVGTDEIIGRYVTDYSAYYGSSSMGAGPGFLGFTLSEKPDVEGSSFVLVYAVGRSGEYTLLDNRIIQCHPIYYNTFHPWISDYGDEDIPNWDDLHDVIVGSVITAVLLEADRCVITLNKSGVQHGLEYVKNDSRLAPFGNGQPRKDAVTSGTIGDYLIVQAPNGVLYV